MTVPVGLRSTMRGEEGRDAAASRLRTSVGDGGCRRENRSAPRDTPRRPCRTGRRRRRVGDRGRARRRRRRSARHTRAAGCSGRRRRARSARDDRSVDDRQRTDGARLGRGARPSTRSGACTSPLPRVDGSRRSDWIAGRRQRQPDADRRRDGNQPRPLSGHRRLRGRGAASWSAAAAGLGSLALGLGASCVLAIAVAKGLNVFGALPAGFTLHEFSAAQTHVNATTILVALAAGVGGMLAVETRAGSAIGVAISVTTIPAAAFFGVAIGLGKFSSSLSALAVLGANVAMMVIGGSTALAVQRKTASRRAPAE